MDSALLPIIIQPSNTAEDINLKLSFFRVSPQAQSLNQNQRYEDSIYETRRQETRRREELERCSDAIGEEAKIKRQLQLEDSHMNSHSSSQSQSESSSQSQSQSSSQRRDLLISVGRSIVTFLNVITTSDWRRFSVKDLQNIRKYTAMHVYEEYIGRGGMKRGNDLTEVFRVAYTVVQTTKLSEAGRDCI